MLFDQAQCEAAEPREVLGDVSVAGAALVFTECHVQAPVAGVLDAPVPTHGFGKGPDIPLEAGDVVPHFACFGAAGLTRLDDQAECPQSFPLFQAA